MKDKELLVEADVQARSSMERSPYNFSDTRWAAYQNQALDSASCGHVQFLAIGPQNTFKEPPEQLPDTKHGMGWKYRFVGWVNLETGSVEKEEKDADVSTAT